MGVAISLSVVGEATSPPRDGGCAVGEEIFFWLSIVMPLQAPITIESTTSAASQDDSLLTGLAPFVIRVHVFYKTQI